MNITNGQLNNLRYKMPSEITNEKGISKFASPKNDISFTGKNFQRIVGVTYKNAKEIVKAIDNTMGNGYFSDLLKKASVEINSHNEITVKPRTLFGDLWKATKALVGTPIRLINSGMKKIGHPLQGNNRVSKWMVDWQAKTEKENALDTVMDILEDFSGTSSNKLSKEADIEKQAQKFKDKLGANIAKIKKNYESKDERTLNRIATSAVSAVFAGNDYHNISMLQKNDEKEAKAAGKDRFQQDMIRAGISAGLTYFSLAALDRYTKSNIWLNAGVIALSSLISEITSRVIKSKSIVPLTPKQAEEIAKKRKNKDKEKKESIQPVKTTQMATPAFKNKLKTDSEIFRNFANPDGSFTSITKLSNQNIQDTQNISTEKKAKKKTNNWAKVALMATIVAHGIYFAARVLKGEYRLMQNKREFAQKYAEQIKKGIVTDEMKAVIQDIIKAQGKKAKRWKGSSIYEKIIDTLRLPKALKSQKTKIDVDQLIEKLKTIKTTSKGKEIESIIDGYLEKLYAVKAGKKTLETDRTSIFWRPLRKGFEKVFSTIYMIFSAPGRMLNAGNNFLFKKETKVFDEIAEEVLEKNYNKELEELGKICLNTGKSKTVEFIARRAKALSESSKAPQKLKDMAASVYKNIMKDDSEIAEIIANRTRRVGEKQETGQLALYSRTLVTLISSYFFANDYFNESLIASEGKDIEAARVKRNEKIGHKAINFVTNGVFMNTFNSIFSGILNNSLLGATAVATATEFVNESTIRTFTCEPRKALKSRQAVIDYEEAQLNKKGLMGAWAKFFRKITGKRTLMQKAGVNFEKTKAHQA